MKRCDKLIDVGRRQFLTGGATAAAAAAAVVTVAIPGPAEATPALARVNYPSQRIGSVKDLKLDHPVQISYPDKDSPGVLLKLGRRVEAGVGPDGDIVAFSTLCPHKGFPLAYVAADKSSGLPGPLFPIRLRKGWSGNLRPRDAKPAAVQINRRFERRYPRDCRGRADLRPA